VSHDLFFVLFFLLPLFFIPTQFIITSSPVPGTTTLLLWGLVADLDGAGVWCHDEGKYTPSMG
jgi:hypothetical protein